VTGADIPLNCQIEGGLLLPHPNGIVIHPDAVIGPNCLLFQQTTLGGGLGAAPTLCGHVDVGAGAKILGAVRIGMNSRIGANAVVLSDVPENSTAVGIPARIIFRENSLAFKGMASGDPSGGNKNAGERQTKRLGNEYKGPKQILAHTGLMIKSSVGVFRGKSIGVQIIRLRFIIAGLYEKRTTAQLLNGIEGSCLNRLMKQRPEMIGVLIWPFQCAQWRASTRLERIINHCGVIDSLGLPWDFSVDRRLVLLNLDEISPGLRVVMDQPLWFMREGLLTINLFTENLRVFSLSFSFFREKDGRLLTVIGGLQGRDIDDALNIYRNLTKLLHGLRPRDLLIEVLKVISKIIGSNEIRAVCENSRYRHHSYFNGMKEKPGLNYDEVWADRGGYKIDENFFKLESETVRRDIEAIKPNKRSMYRKRFDFIDSIEFRLRQDISLLSPIEMPDA
jgi:uncharacterized protein VirK/YbjX